MHLNTFFSGKNGVHSTEKVKNLCLKGITPVGAVFSAPVQTGPGAHSASCTMNTGSISLGSSGQGEVLTSYPNLRSKLKKEYSYTFAPPPGLHGLLQGERNILSV